MSKKASKGEKMRKPLAPVEMFACLDDKGENYIVEIELPGAEKKTVDLRMHDDLISVRAERPDVALMGHLHFPLKVNPKKAEASFKQGLLVVRVPVREKRPPPVSIKVK